MTHTFFTDTATARLQYVGDATDAEITPTNAETVQLDTQWEAFFGTDEFVQFEATVAQPIVQPYFYDGEIHYFRKDESELQRAQAQLDNLPWTMGHPPDDRITDADQIRGFWSDPTYNDGQHARVNLPANDTEAIRFAVDNDHVSIGFSGTLDWLDDETVDAVQRDMAYDHVASVESGRCPPEKGCGLHTDEDPLDDTHGHATHLTDDEDISASYAEGASSADGTVSDAELSAKFSEDDWLSWSWQGGTATGRVTNVSTSAALSVGETTRNPTEKGEAVYKLKHWDDGAFGNMKVAYESNLTSTSAPEGYTDSIDAVQSQQVEDPFDPSNETKWTIGDWVAFTRDGETVHGKIAHVDNERALIKQYDSDEEMLSDQSIALATSSLREWVGPMADTCPGDTCSCGCHVDNKSRATNESTDSCGCHASQAAHTDSQTDNKHSAPDGIYVDGGEWYGVAPDETSDGEPKYDLNTCDDVTDAFNLRNNGDYSIATSTLVARIKRAADAHDCTVAQKPWADAAEKLTYALANNE